MFMVNKDYRNTILSRTLRCGDPLIGPRPRLAT